MDFQAKKQKIVLDVFRNYEYDLYVRLTGDRHMRDMPEKMQRWLHQFVNIQRRPVFNDQEQKAQLKKLRKIRMYLKIEFFKLKLRTVIAKCLDKKKGGKFL